MKIGIVSNLYPPEARGGAELVAQRVADALYQRGHEVFVLTTQPFDGIRSLFPRIRERTLEARGGAELVAQRVADALYQRGHEVFVLTTQPFDGIRSLFPRIRERTLE